jgi:hypothetical protein
VGNSVAPGIGEDAGVRRVPRMAPVPTAVGAPLTYGSGWQTPPRSFLG